MHGRLVWQMRSAERSLHKFGLIHIKNRLFPKARDYIQARKHLINKTYHQKHIFFK